MSTKEHSRGFTLFLAVVIASVVLAIGLSILTITLKEYVFSSLGRESEIAFYAADAGMECALYWDSRKNPDDGSDESPFKLSNNSGWDDEVVCMDAGDPDPGDNYPTGNNDHRTYKFAQEWNNSSGQTLCAKITVEKWNSGTDQDLDGDGDTDCEAGTKCTRVESRGYNVACDGITASQKVVERALRATY